MPTAVSIVRSQPYGFLATAAEGGPNVRLVQHLRVDDDASVWIGTSRASRKAAEAQAQPDVTYAVEDRSSFAYVAVRGRARHVFDDAVRAELWEPALQLFFPAGPHGPDFMLLHIEAVQVELMSFAHGIHPEPYGLKAAVVAVPR